jgi:hypothetical protein
MSNDPDVIAGMKALQAALGDDLCQAGLPLPRGRQLVTLEDAGNYITRLPKAEHEAQEWQAAMEALILVATSGGPTMFARIGIMRALKRGHVGAFNPDRKDHHWGRRKLARDR